MKIGERWQYDEATGKVLVKQTHDAAPVIRSAKVLADNAPDRLGDMMHVGRIPTRLYFEWAKEAGVSPSDSDAMQEVLRRKMLDGSFSAFRVQEGTY